MKNLFLSNIVKSCLLIGLGWILTGCGQSGPLYLPKQPAQPIKPASTTNNKTTNSMPSSSIETQVTNQNNIDESANPGMPTTTDPN